MKALIRCMVIMFMVISGFSSCGFPHDAVFFAEQYWWDLIAQDPGLTRKLEQVCNDHGFNFKLIIAKPNEDYAQQLKHAAAAPGVKLVVTGPLMASDVNSVAHDMAEMQFVVIGASEYFKFTTRNIIGVTFDRTTAYNRAGEILATLLGPDYYYMYENLQGKKVGIIFSEETDKAREQVDGFEQGFLEEQPRERVVVDTLENYGDRVEAVRAVENLYSQDVRIFLLKIYTLIPACIQKIVSLNAYYIIEDWKYINEYNEHLLFSIEEDITGALASALMIIKTPEKASPHVLKQFISVPCKIHWGGAILPPTELKNIPTLSREENP